MRARGFDVTYVRNITDIDDKIIKRAIENNETCDALTARFIDAMHDGKGIMKSPDDERTVKTGSDGTLDPDAIAETYLHVHRQHRSAWTWEVELRPWAENF